MAAAAQRSVARRPALCSPARVNKKGRIAEEHSRAQIRLCSHSSPDTRTLPFHFTQTASVCARKKHFHNSYSSCEACVIPKHDLRGEEGGATGHRPVRTGRYFPSHWGWTLDSLRQNWREGFPGPT